MDRDRGAGERGAGERGHGGNNDCKVYVGNLPADIRARDLEDIFYKYGKIVDVDLHDRRGPPFAFVEFEDPRFGFCYKVSEGFKTTSSQLQRCR
jgi:hypothetical protein